jgi:hypothetical protein
VLFLFFFHITVRRYEKEKAFTPYNVWIYRGYNMEKDANSDKKRNNSK